MKKGYKVTDVQREKKIGVAAENLEELILKSCKKLGVSFHLDYYKSNLFNRLIECLNSVFDDNSWFVSFMNLIFSVWMGMCVKASRAGLDTYWVTLTYFLCSSMSRGRGRGNAGCSSPRTARAWMMTTTWARCRRKLSLYCSRVLKQW